MKAATKTLMRALKNHRSDWIKQNKAKGEHYGRKEAARSLRKMRRIGMNKEAFVKYHSKRYV